MNRAFLLSLAILLALVIPAQATSEIASDVWLFVNTDELHLAIMQGSEEIKIFDNIAIGSNGPTLRKIRGDETTPLGEFTITETRERTRERSCGRRRAR